MTVYECVDGWLAQFDELDHYVSEECDGKLKFKEAIEALSRKYKVVDYDAKNNRAHIHLLENGHKLKVTFCGDKGKNMALLDTVECWFIQSRFHKCSISKFRSGGYYVRKYESEYGKKFDSDIYTYTDSYIIEIYKLKYKTSDRIDTYYFYDKEKALNFARVVQKKLANEYKECHYITIHKLADGWWPNGQEKVPNSRHVLSSKSKKETIFELRRNLVFDLFVDEYYHEKPDYYEEGGKDKVVMMSIVKLDKEGNLENDMICCSSKKNAKKMANDLIDNWMKKNGFTIYKDECNENRYLKLCEKRDFCNSIKVNCVQNIAEFNVLMMEVDI